MSRWGGANSNNKWLRLEDEACGRYNCWDAYWTARLLPGLIADARELGQWDWWEAHGEPFQHAVLAMAERGLGLDHPALAIYASKVRTELGETDARIRTAATAAGFTFTDKFPNSRAQVSQLLFGVLGLRGGKRTAGGSRYSVDQDALTRVLRDLRVRDEGHRNLLFDLFHRTRLQTILTRYLTLESESDGRVRPIIKMNHVKTWRLAYANPALQQWPEEARHIFRARPGCIFLSADYSQLEARLLAYYSNDLPSIAAFEAGKDIHAVNACDLFALTEAEWAQIVQDDLSEPYRTYAKSGFLYRMIYGGTAASGDKKLFCPCPKCARKMPSTLRLSPSEAANKEERWHARHPAVKEWQRQVSLEVRRTHRFPLLLGGFRYLSSPWSRDLDRELKNIPMQSGGARVMIRAQNRLHSQGAPIVLQHHDSFLLEVPEAHLDRWAVTVRTVMEEPVKINDREVSLPVDIKVGTNWGRYHATENPAGLRKYAYT